MADDKALRVAARAIDGFRTEIARLQAALTEAKHHWKACEEGWNKAIKQAEGFLAERDDYKARDKLRKRVLERLSVVLHPEPGEEDVEGALVEHWGFWRSECKNEFCRLVLAAIDATPEEAREKEGR